MNKYFVWDPADSEFTFHATEADQFQHAKNSIESYKDDEWGCDVDQIVCGVITHRATQTNIEQRPVLLDHGFDKDGRYWPSDTDLLCDYEMEEI